MRLRSSAEDDFQAAVSGSGGMDASIRCLQPTACHHHRYSNKPQLLLSLGCGDGCAPLSPPSTMALGDAAGGWCLQVLYGAGLAQALLGGSWEVSIE